MSDRRRDGNYVGFASTAFGGTLSCDGVWDLNAQYYWEDKGLWPDTEPLQLEYLVTSNTTIPLPSAWDGADILVAGVAPSFEGSGGDADLVGQQNTIPPGSGGVRISFGNGALSASTLDNTVYYHSLSYGSGLDNYPTPPVAPLIPTFGTPSWNDNVLGGGAFPGAPGIAGGGGARGFNTPSPNGRPGNPGKNGGAHIWPVNLSYPNVIAPQGYGPAPSNWSIVQGPFAGGRGGNSNRAAPGDPGESLPLAGGAPGSNGNNRPGNSNDEDGVGGGGAGCGVSFTDPGTPGNTFNVRYGGGPGAPKANEPGGSAPGICYVRIIRS